VEGRVFFGKFSRVQGGFREVVLCMGLLRLRDGRKGVKWG